jgi:hypothetical protein
MNDLFETEFQVTPNNLVKGMTWGLGLLFLCMGIFIPLLTFLYANEEEYLWLFLLILFSVIFGLTYIGAWAYSVQTYFVSDKNIRIQRPINSISIPVNKIKKIEPFKLNVFKTIRKWGNSGIFSITGLLYTKEHGDFWVYAKNDNYVMIYADKKYVLSPDDKELFIQTVKSRIEKSKK